MAGHSLTEEEIAVFAAKLRAFYAELSATEQAFFSKVLARAATAAASDADEVPRQSVGSPLPGC